MEHQDNISVQDKYAPNSICFGCGPANEKGYKLNHLGLKMDLKWNLKLRMNIKPFLESLMVE